MTLVMRKAPEFGAAAASTRNGSCPPECPGWFLVASEFVPSATRGFSRKGFVNHNFLGSFCLRGRPAMNQILIAICIVAGFASFEALFAFAVVKLKIDL